MVVKRASGDLPADLIYLPTWQLAVVARAPLRLFMRSRTVTDLFESMITVTDVRSRGALNTPPYRRHGFHSAPDSDMISPNLHRVGHRNDPAKCLFVAGAAGSPRALW